MSNKKQQEVIRARIKVLQRTRDECNKQLTECDNELHDLRLQEARLQFDCHCVRLNNDLNIFDMTGQHKANRRSLMFGLVADCLSADNNCPECCGKGKTKKTLQEEIARYEAEEEAQSAG